MTYSKKEAYMIQKALLFFALVLSAFAATDESLDREQKSQTATAITIIFDNSGSMQERNKMTQAKAAFDAWLQAQSEDTRFSLIHFQNRKGKVAVPLGDNNRADVIKTVKALQPRGKTPIVGSLKIAGKRIRFRRKKFSPYERHIVIVFTDGVESFDPEGNRGVNREIKKLLREDIEVIGIGFHGQGNYMRQVATQYFDANNTNELKKSLDQVTAEIDANVEIELSEQDKKLMQEMDFSTPQAQASPREEIEERTPPPSNKKSKGVFARVCVAILAIAVVSNIVKGIFKGK